MDIIICIDCGAEIHITNRMQKKTKRCRACAKARQRVLSKDYTRRKRKKLKASRARLCNCGCGRAVGYDLRLLSDYCYRAGEDFVDEPAWPREAWL